MRGIVMCEESQIVTQAFRDLGHEFYSCDIKLTSGAHPEWHIQSDGEMHSKDILYNGKWDFIIGHPDCTYLTVTANKWLKDQPARESGALVGEARREARERAIIFFMMIANAPCTYNVIENPVGCMSTVWRKPDQIIQPFEFGHKEPKKTCLWLKGLPLLKPTGIVEPEYHTTASGKRMPLWYAYADKSQGQAHRAEIRSKTFPGIAQAIAKQYGDYISNPHLEQLTIF